MTSQLLFLKLIRALPQRVTGTLYHRILKRYASHFESLYTNASLKLAPGIKMNLSVRDAFHGELVFTGIYEKKLSKQILKIASISPGVMIDVGANYGYYSLLWCHANASNVSFAVEASRANIAPLRANIDLNGLSDRIELHEWAASRENGVVTFNLGSRDETGWGGISPTNKHNNSSGAPSTEDGMLIEVPTHRLDQEFGNKNISVLKIDCEGADAWVLEGASELLKRREVQHVFFEENTQRQEELGIKAGASHQMLSDWGYRVERISDETGNLNFHAFQQALPANGFDV